ncbi:aldehyde dehydrogenase family protein [Falsochrobactrum shanghaiense]|uniref:aldehyde dehydrogenase (NAD(+)) n=1 Tax=Falsochrobactrum shanghaiense TaxID=2201899 RepID=A0A316JBV9_9HYPH|nr:aldehyde dehydrogenase family protein [Falsochrobactrum shanghaiense]PWL16493.1 aldehyde dehydrogenase family protein [Falsochrobactrum shanghaiense]
MTNNLKFFINGAWVDPHSSATIDVVDPSTEEAFTKVAIGDAQDVDRAVLAAREAFKSFSHTTVEERADLISRVITAYKKRGRDLANAISKEVGAPLEFAYTNQVGAGLAHFSQTLKALRSFEFEKHRGPHSIVFEPIGVVALITPWNWPLNQIACKVAPALAAGCSMILKPSEVAPLNALILAEIFEEAGVPPGVFNLINGDGPGVGHALAAHPDVDMISITGSTRAGVLVAKAAADTIKRVHQELGGKSPNILFEDAEFPKAVTKGIYACFNNSGQSCNAPTRMFVPRSRQDEVKEIAREAAKKFRVGDPKDETTKLGPVINRTQYEKIQSLIETGIKEGASVVVGGIGRPDGLNRGFYVQPTIFADVTSEMTIAVEEIFGPVLSIIPYDDINDAINQANDTVYGLAAYVQSADLTKARDAARRLRAGSVYINYPDWDVSLPFGGYKQSGNGREQGEFGLEAFLEIKGIAGYGTE